MHVPQLFSITTAADAWQNVTPDVIGSIGTVVLSCDGESGDAAYFSFQGIADGYEDEIALPVALSGENTEYITVPTGQSISMTFPFEKSFVLLACGTNSCVAQAVIG